MAQSRAVLPKAGVVERRPVPEAVHRGPAASVTPLQALQQRMGHQAFVQRSSMAGASTKATRLAHVSSPRDASEREAEEMARKVARMREPVTPAAKPQAARAQPAKGAVQREAAPVAATPVAAAPPARAVPGAGAGAPLPRATRAFMEPRFGADFSNVRIHTGEAAAQQSASLSAHAFTVGNDVFFGRGKFQPESPSGRELIAHELTHTIQQGAVVQRSVDTAVVERTPPKVQRLGIGDALDWIADKANYLPGFRLLTIVLGLNPVNMAPVDRSAANLLRALLELIPVTGALLAQALENYGVFAKAGAWVEAQVRTLGMVGSQLKTALDRFLDSLGWRDIFSLDEVYERGKRIFTEPIGRLLDFGRNIAGAILGFVREAILLPLARLAEGTRGYDLVKALLGQDPITGEPVPQTPENLIGGFMKFAGREEVWENVKKANAIPRAWAWFQAAKAGLLGYVRQVPGLFVAAFNAIEIADLVILPRAFQKVAGIFGPFIVSFATWAGEAAWSLLQIIFEVLAPAAIPYLKKAGAAFRTILANPVGFVGNLVKAAKLGFLTFADNIGQHLKTSIIEWLTGSLPGVYIPKKLELKEILKFVLSVLGISWANIRQKLVKVVGEPAVKAMETGFEIVVALVTEGPAAAWEKIKEQLANLKDMAIGAITDFVVETIVKKAVMKVVSLLVPGGAFIQAIISIYDTIMVLIDKLAKIIQVAKAFLDSVIDIANGALEGAAKKVEGTLAGLLTLAISFLAGFLGLGKIADKVMEIINTKVRAPVDKAIDFVIDWIVKTAKALFARGKAAVKALVSWWKREEKFTVNGEKHRVFFAGDARSAQVRVASDEKSLADFLRESKASGGDAEAIKAAEAAMVQIDVLRKSRRPPTPDAEAPEDAQINKHFDAIAAVLPKLFAGDEWGTETNPVLLKYPKKALSLYRTIYLGPLVSGPLSQAELRKVAGVANPVKSGFDPKKEIKPSQLGEWVGKGGVVKAYSPFDPQPWPYGASWGNSPNLGVVPQYQAQVGTSFEYDKGATPGGRKLNAQLKRYGYYGKADGGENSDGDHVLEAQLIGANADQIPNMWPLDKTENRHGLNLETACEWEVLKPPIKSSLGLGAAVASKHAKKTKKPRLRVMIKSTK